jgi:hypothetical protein
MFEMSCNEFVRNFTKRYFYKNKTVNEICKLTLAKKFGFVLRLGGLYCVVEALISRELFYMFLSAVIMGLNAFYYKLIDSDIFLSFLLDFGDNHTCIGNTADHINNFINVTLSVVFYFIFSLLTCLCFCCNCCRKRDSSNRPAPVSSKKNLYKTVSNEDLVEEFISVSFNDLKKDMEHSKDKFCYLKVIDKDDQENFYHKMVELGCNLTSGTIKIDQWFTIMHNLEHEGLLKNEYDLFRFSYYGEQAGRSIVHEKFTDQKVNFMSLSVVHDSHFNKRSVKEIKIMFHKKTKKNWHVRITPGLKNLKSAVNKKFVFEGLLD